MNGAEIMRRESMYAIHPDIALIHLYARIWRRKSGA